MNKTVFCQCQECNLDVCVGDEMVSLTLSTDRVDGEFLVQPLGSSSVGLWCKACAPNAIKRITDSTPQFEPINSLKKLLVEMLEDESEFKRKPSNDLYAQGQLSATQYNRVKIESILESLGSRRTATLDAEKQL